MAVTNVDIGLNPTGTRHDRVVPGYAVETGIKFGDVLVWDTSSTVNHRACKRTTTAGDAPLAGVCVTQTDPVNGTAIGDVIEICSAGIAEVNVVSSQALTKGDKLVSSTTAGAAKKLASETTPDILGRVNMDLASTASVTRVSVEINIYQHA
jgi:hypothetical protein